MRWLVPPDQGPYVEIAYTEDADGGVYKRVTDHTEPPGSEWRVRYYRAQWLPCEPPKADA